MHEEPLVLILPAARTGVLRASTSLTGVVAGQFRNEFQDVNGELFVDVVEGLDRQINKCLVRTRVSDPSNLDSNVSLVAFLADEGVFDTDSFRVEVNLANIVLLLKGHVRLHRALCLLVNFNLIGPSQDHDAVCRDLVHGAELDVVARLIIVLFRKLSLSVFPNTRDGISLHMNVVGVSDFLDGEVRHGLHVDEVEVT